MDHRAWSVLRATHSHPRRRSLVLSMAFGIYIIPPVNEGTDRKGSGSAPRASGRRSYPVGRRLSLASAERGGAGSRASPSGSAPPDVFRGARALGTSLSPTGTKASPVLVA